MGALVAILFAGLAGEVGQEPSAATLADAGPPPSAATPEDAGPSTSTATLEIEVRAMGTREPIPLAQLDWPDGGLAEETDADGRLRLDVSPGPLTLRVRSTGFVPRSFDETLAPDERLAVI